MELLHLAYDQVYDFLEKGGDIVYVILGVIFVLWVLILERVAYLQFGFWKLFDGLNWDWKIRHDRHSWAARQIRTDYVCQLRIGLNQNLATIKAIIALCPLLGLLGTVTGMIEVFDVMVHFGDGSPRAMASGISKAILSTVAGMVGALTGIFAHSVLTRMVARRQTLAEASIALKP